MCLEEVNENSVHLNWTALRSAVKQYNVSTFYAFALYWLIKKHPSCLKIMYFYRILLWKFTSIRSRPFLCTVKQTSRNKYDFRFICRPEIWTQLKCFEEPRLLEKKQCFNTTSVRDFVDIFCLRFIILLQRICHWLEKLRSLVNDIDYLDMNFVYTYTIICNPYKDKFPW